MAKRVIASKLGTSGLGHVRDTPGARTQSPMSAWEAGVLDEANAEISAGLVLRDEDLDDYLDALVLDGPDRPTAILKPLRR